MHNDDDDDEIVVQVKLISLSWHNKSEDMGNYDQRMSRMSVKSLQHVTLLAFWKRSSIHACIKVKSY